MSACFPAVTGCAHLCEHHSDEKVAVCTGVLSGWPRDKLVITTVRLSGPVCPPTAGLTYLINMDRPLAYIHTHTHTRTNTYVRPPIRIHMHMLKDSLAHVDTATLRCLKPPHPLKICKQHNEKSQTNSHWFELVLGSQIWLTITVRCGGGPEGKGQGLRQVVDMWI